MKTIIFLIYTVLHILTVTSYSQFSKPQIDELTAKGISYAIEPNNQSVKDRAEEITREYNGNFIHSLCAVFQNVYRGWNYRPDPNGMEYFENAGTSVYTYTGDCDDYAILMVSLIKALGGEGRVICVSGHAYPEIYIGKDLTEADFEKIKDDINQFYQNAGYRKKPGSLNYHADINGTYWLNFDYQDPFPGGSFVEYSPHAEHLVIYSNGSYELAYLNQ
jgi:hypothetical protein